MSALPVLSEHETDAVTGGINYALVQVSCAQITLHGRKTTKTHISLLSHGPHQKVTVASFVERFTQD
jgi:hypothetical protein